MELFEEALQKWEQALSIRQRDSASTSTPVPWDSRKQQESMSENISEVGPHMLKGLGAGSSKQWEVKRRAN